MKKTARVILTLKCKRTCSYCCNTSEMLEKAIPLKDNQQLANYDEICVTGGEPGLVPALTTGFIISMRQMQSPRKMIYLYTAMWAKQMALWLDYVDGIHYTIHAEDGEKEISQFERCQGILPAYPTVSRRLRIVHGYRYSIIHINPCSWDHMDMKEFVPNQPLPTHEDLFIVPEA